MIDRLPIAIALVSSSGLFLGKSGGMASLLGEKVPSHDPREANRWSFRDERGAVIPPTEWPSARALRGERNYTALLGTLHDGEDLPIKVVSVPTLDPTSEVAAVTFLQVLDTSDRSAAGSHLDLQQRLIDNLVQAIATSWQHLEPVFARRPAA